VTHGASAGRVKVAFRTLGCKVNRVESDAIAAELIGRGAVLSQEDDADVVVINTCTVTGEADAKARKAVRHALGAPGEPIVVVTGCLATLDADGLCALGPRVVVESDKQRIATLVRELRGLSDANGVPHDVAVSALRAGDGFRSRSLIKIEDGCDNFCSYCIIPYARGVPRGVTLAHAVSEACALVDAGTSEIVLTGINIGRYTDRDTGADLADLIGAIAATGIARLRLSSIEPPDLTPRLLDALAATPALCEHLHVPLQSGSDAVLSAMGRSYTRSQYAGWLDDARAAIPGLAVTTDLIAGFPEETDEQHAETVEFVERMGFSQLHVFRYSMRAGTPAAGMRQVPAQIKAARAAQLRCVGDRLHAAFAAARIGREVELLVEDAVDDRAVGTTREYLRASVPASAGVCKGDLVRFTLSNEALGPR